MTRTTRPPSAAGRLYPQDAGERGGQVKELMANRARSDARVVIAPHASVRLAGEVYGSVYGALEPPTAVVVLAPDHQQRVSRAAIASRGRWQIPGASLVLGSAIAEDLRGSALVPDDSSAHDTEHSIEAQIPFLVEWERKPTLVPILLGRLNLPSCMRVGTALASTVVRNGRGVVVAATTHLHMAPTEEALLLLRDIEQLDYEALAGRCEKHPDLLCAPAATVAAMVAASELGATKGEIVAQASSPMGSSSVGGPVTYPGVLFV